MKMDDTTKATFKIHESYVNYWLGMATTGAGKNKDLFHGFGQDIPFTDEEKIEDCLQTALKHIHLMQNLIDKHKEDEYMLKKGVT